MGRIRDRIFRQASPAARAEAASSVRIPVIAARLYSWRYPPIQRGSYTSGTGKLLLLGQVSGLCPSTGAHFKMPCMVEGKAWWSRRGGEGREGLNPHHP